VWQQKIQDIGDHTREQYATPRADVEKILLDSLTLDIPGMEERRKPRTIHEEPSIHEQTVKPKSVPVQPDEPGPEPQPIKEDREASSHRYLQTLVKKMAEARGYVAVLESQVPNSAEQVDVLLSKEGKTIAVEICITTDAEWEMHNIQKCLAAQYDVVVSVCGDPKQLEKIRKKCTERIPDIEQKQVHFFTPDVLFSFLDSAVKNEIPQEQIIKGYRVNVTYDDVTKEDMDRKRASVAKVVMDSLRKKKK
jgi:hypothetical protein